MQFALSPAAEAALERLEQQDPLAYEAVVDDLALIGMLGFDAMDIGTMVAEWAYLTGPTGRVGYWISPFGDDSWLIETIDIS